MPRIETNIERCREIAEAFVIIAKANHYMVSFSYNATLEELDIARQFLISMSLRNPIRVNSEIDKAITLIEMEIKGKKI